jgi:hypothetical protein
MKKNFILLLSLVLGFVFVACDKATSTSDGRIEGIFTVSGNILYPECVDTFYRVDNMSEFDIKNGDRALMTLGYEIDNLVGAKFARWYIKSINEILPSVALTPLADVDANIYSSAIAGVGGYPKYGAYWMWRNVQNIHIGYYSDGRPGAFKLSPVKMSGDTLCFVLNSKIIAGDKPMAKLLSFDVSAAASMLSADDAEKLSSLDSICTKITTKVDIVSEDKVKELFIGGGKYKNPF